MLNFFRKMVNSIIKFLTPYLIKIHELLTMSGISLYFLYNVHMFHQHVQDILASDPFFLLVPTITSLFIDYNTKTPFCSALTYFYFVSCCLQGDHWNMSNQSSFIYSLFYTYIALFLYANYLLMLRLRRDR